MSGGTLPTTFSAGTTGEWRVDRVLDVRGQSLPFTPRVALHTGWDAPADGLWTLRGITSHARYLERSEKGPLDVASPALARPEATRAALIPIKKSAAWWAMTQDERRTVFEGRSHHIEGSMPYLPRIARKLFHARDLGGPFDFLTWFEFAPEHTAAFDDLVGMLRSREEWTFVEREVDIRLER